MRLVCLSNIVMIEMPIPGLLFRYKKVTFNFHAHNRRNIKKGKRTGDKK